MPRFVKLFGIIVGIVILLFVLAGILLVTLVNPNDFKKNISQMVYQQTGRQLTIDGKIAWSFFPWVGLTVSDARLSNPSGFANSDFISLKQADLSVKLLPLLESKFRVGKVLLKGLTINLVENKSGQNNWQFTAQKLDKTEAQVAHEDKSGKKQLDLSIDNVTIENAKVNYINQSSNVRYTISDFNLQSANISLDNDFVIKSKFTFQSNQLPTTLMMTLSGKLLLSPKNNLYAFHEFNLNIDISPSQLISQHMNINFSGGIEYNTAKDLLTANNLLISCNSMQLQANATVTAFSKNPQARGNIVLAPLNLKDYLLNFRKNISLASPASLQKISASTNFLANNKQILLDQLKVNLDSTTITGYLHVNNLQTQQMKFDLTMDQIKLDNYLSKPATTAANGNANAANTNKAKASNDPFSALRRLNLDGRIMVKLLQFNNQKLTDANVVIKAANGVLALNPFSTQIYQGSIAGNATINAQSTTPRYQLMLNGKSLQLNSLSANPKLSGTADINAQINTAGIANADLMRNLNGNFRMQINNGIYKGVDLVYQLNRVYAYLNKAVESKANSANQTAFGDLTASGTIQNGLVSNRDLKVESKDFRLTGAGTINLVSQALDYSLQVLPMQSIVPSGQRLITAGKTEIPLRLTGTFSSPLLVPDFAAIAKLIAKQQIEKGVKKQIENAIGSGNLPSNVNDAIQKGIGKFLN